MRKGVHDTGLLLLFSGPRCIKDCWGMVVKEIDDNYQFAGHTINIVVNSYLV